MSSSPPNGGAAAAAKNAADLQTSIEIVERFLKQYPESGSTASAQATLAAYKKIGDAGAVKFRGDWISAPDFDAIKKGWSTAAEPAATFYKAGQLKEALNAVGIVLARDPQNPDALAVGGLAAFRSNNLGLALRTSRSSPKPPPPAAWVSTTSPSSTTSARTRPTACRNYAKAVSRRSPTTASSSTMSLRPSTPTRTTQNRSTTRPSVALYEQAEARIEAQMLKDKIYRWGSTWVGEEQLGKLKQALEDIKTQMRELDAKYRGSRPCSPTLRTRSNRPRLTS